MTATELPEPTIQTNVRAADLACMTERNRVLKILALANPPIAQGILTAIERGTPAAQVQTKLTGSAPGNDAGTTAAASTKRAPGADAAHPWSAVTDRFKTRQGSA